MTERLYDATLQCAKNIITAIQNNAFKCSATPNLACGFEGKRGQWCQIYLHHCNQEQARAIIWLFNTWKPDTTLGRFGGVYFTTEKIMENVKVCEE